MILLAWEEHADVCNVLLIIRIRNYHNFVMMSNVYVHVLHEVVKEVSVKWMVQEDVNAMVALRLKKLHFHHTIALKAVVLRNVYKKDILQGDAIQSMDNVCVEVIFRIAIH